MTREELQVEWGRDCHIDKARLETESLETSVLHSKYYNILLGALRLKRKLKGKYDAILASKTLYYLGLNHAEPANNYPHKIAKQNLELYLNNDKDLQVVLLELSDVTDTVDFLKSIIDSINKRGFQIKNSNDAQKFKNGIS